MGVSISRILSDGTNVAIGFAFRDSGGKWCFTSIRYLRNHLNVLSTACELLYTHADTSAVFLSSGFELAKINLDLQQQR